MSSNPQSVWEYDLLWAKARAYIQRALSVNREDDLFPFWASLSLEFLARASLAKISPALLADASDADGRNIFYALGREPKIKNFVPKSIAISDVLTRCEQIVPEFTKELESFCKGLTNKRNEELHSGGIPFSKLPNHSWLPRFYEASKALLHHQGKTLEDFLGGEEAKAANVMLAAIADETAKSVKQIINAHESVWKQKDPGEQKTLAISALAHAQPWRGHVIECPSCKSAALLNGEEITQQPATLEGDQLVVRSVILPTELTCTACGLKIKGHNQVYAAGHGSQFTNTVRMDAVEYYANEDTSDGEEYNNE